MKTPSATSMVSVLMSPDFLYRFDMSDGAPTVAATLTPTAN